MRLQRRLRGEYDTCAAAHMNGCRERVAAEHAGTGTHENRVSGALEVEGARDAERRLGVAVREHGAAAAPLEGQLEARVAPDCGHRAVIARLKGSRAFLSEGEPFRRAAVGYDS